MLPSRVDGNSHKWIDVGNRGETGKLQGRRWVEEAIAFRFYLEKKKFFATSESTRKAAGNNNIKIVHDVPLMPGNLCLSALTMLLQVIPDEIGYQLLHNYTDQI